MSCYVCILSEARYIVTKAANIPHSRNFKGMGTSFRRNDVWDRLGGQELLMIGEWLP